jgi:hypothetical protein
VSSDTIVNDASIYSDFSALQRYPAQNDTGQGRTFGGLQFCELARQMIQGKSVAVT